MKEKNLTDVFIELGLIPDLPDDHTLDGDGTNRFTLDGKSQNEEKSRE